MSRRQESGKGEGWGGKKKKGEKGEKERGGRERSTGWERAKEGKEGKMLQESEISHPGSCVSPLISLVKSDSLALFGKEFKSKPKKSKSKVFQRDTHSIGRMPTILKSESSTRT